MGCILPISEHFQHDRKEGTSSVKVAAGNFHIRSVFLGCYSNLAREMEAEPGAGTVLLITVVPSWTVQCRLRKKHSQSQHNISSSPTFSSVASWEQSTIKSAWDKPQKMFFTLQACFCIYKLFGEVLWDSRNVETAILMHSADKLSDFKTHLPVFNELNYSV